MKTLFIEARYNKSAVNVVKKIKLPKKIGLVGAIQFTEQLKEIKEYLESKGHEVTIGGQLLGCNANRAIGINHKVDAFLCIGSGDFHPIEVARRTKKEVIVANPITGKVGKISKEEVINYEKNLKGKIMKFIAARKVGILVSNKPGQENLKYALQLKDKIKDKECFIFLDNDIKIDEFDNFREIDVWINTACARVEGKGIVNIEDVLEYIYKGKIGWNLENPLVR
ncbi:MAG TPA: diphthamide synthesis protein [Candidatus Nanoarchaeia archaeon]|nr:diphthamide synthesis protein [Candidatus Nanoarchaeia archaeon]